MSARRHRPRCAGEEDISERSGRVRGRAALGVAGEVLASAVSSRGRCGEERKRTESVIAFATKNRSKLRTKPRKGHVRLPVCLVNSPKALAKKVA